MLFIHIPFLPDTNLIASISMIAMAEAIVDHSLKWHLETHEDKKCSNEQFSATRGCDGAITVIPTLTFHQVAGNCSPISENLIPLGEQLMVLSPQLQRPSLIMMVSACSDLQVSILLILKALPIFLPFLLDDKSKFSQITWKLFSFWIVRGHPDWDVWILAFFHLPLKIRRALLVMAVYVLGVRKVIADILSKCRTLPSNWILDKKSCHWILDLGLIPKANLFVTREKHLLTWHVFSLEDALAFVYLYLYTLAISPSLGGSRQHKRTTKTMGTHSVPLAMTRDPAEFGWHCWSNTAHPPQSFTTYVASQMPSPLLPLPQGCPYRANPWQQQMPIRTASQSFATHSYS